MEQALLVPNTVLLAVKMGETTVPAQPTADSSAWWVIRIGGPVVKKLRAFLGMYFRPYIKLFFVPTNKQYAAAYVCRCLCVLPMSSPGVCAEVR